MSPPVVLASSSVYRARVLRDAGWDIRIVVPDVDEGSLRHLFEDLGPEAYAVELARRKARSVRGEVDPASLVIGADQVGVRHSGSEAAEVGKPATRQEAVEQIMAVAGGSYRLVNGVVVVRAADDREWSAVDIHVVHLAAVEESAARSYVDTHRPLDVVGGLRIEDPSGFIDRVDGSGRDGVMGMPLSVVSVLIDRARPL